jgi:hypothetical protein
MAFRSDPIRSCPSGLDTDRHASGEAVRVISRCVPTTTGHHMDMMGIARDRGVENRESAKARLLHQSGSCDVQQWLWPRLRPCLPARIGGTLHGTTARRMLPRMSLRCPTGPPGPGVVNERSECPDGPGIARGNLSPWSSLLLHTCAGRARRRRRVDGARSRRRWKPARTIQADAEPNIGPAVTDRYHAIEA